MLHVIAVAGPVGSGKTSLVNALAASLQDASVLCFDHYEDLTGKNRQEMAQWLTDGADFNQFAIPGLAEAVTALIRGESVVDPRTGQRIEPRHYLLFEMPFGKAYTPTAKLIDMLLWIEVPLAIALARKLREHAGMFLRQGGPEYAARALAWLHGYTGNYIEFVHQTLLLQQERVRPDADLVLDGTESLEAMLDQALQAIRLQTGDRA